MNRRKWLCMAGVVLLSASVLVAGVATMQPASLAVSRVASSVTVQPGVGSNMRPPAAAGPNALLVAEDRAAPVRVPAGGNLAGSLNSRNLAPPVSGRNTQVMTHLGTYATPAMPSDITVPTSARGYSFDTSVGSAAPPDTLFGETMTPFGVDPQPGGFSPVTSVTDPCSPAGSITFNQQVLHADCAGWPDGWMNWSHGYTGDIYYTNGAHNITLTLSAGLPPACAFYFYVEPDMFQVETFQVTADDGSSTTFQAFGDAGAAYCGVYGPGLTSITVSNHADDDFAIGEFGIACKCDLDVMGACCDPSTAGCDDAVLWSDCTAPLQWSYDTQCDDLDPPCGGNPGACCDIYTGQCTDNVLALNCTSEFHSSRACGELNPPCGNPGCCCDSPEPGVVTEPRVELAANCNGRFLSGVLEADCVAAAFAPQCGMWVPTGLLYAPSWHDDPVFRSVVSALLGGAPVDFWDAGFSASTPTVEYCSAYAAVMTWANLPYADAVGMGDMLADYVDQGGRAILGQWCRQSDQACYLQGRIMDDPAYCPVLACSTSFSTGVYLGDGTQCPTHGPAGTVRVLSAADLDVVSSIAAGAMTDGTFGGTSYVAVWTGNAKVWYSPGNTGLQYTTGDVAVLTANEVLCTNRQGACCNVHTGECIDHQEAQECFGAGGVLHSGVLCAGLVPPCGDPGCCCDQPESGEVTDPHFAYHADCNGRFISGVTGADCVGDAFEPECGLFYPHDVLYAPTYDDTPNFRAMLSALLGGGTVDYWDASQGTPPLSTMQEYTAVFTWVDLPYADAVGMGDTLADYVDAGGRVLLGQFCRRGTVDNYLQGRIMDDPAYCPVLTISNSYGKGTYNGDGTHCATQGTGSGGGIVTSLSANFLDIVSAITDDAMTDGTWSSTSYPDSYIAVWRPDSLVWYSPGNTGGADIFTTGDVAILTANELLCVGHPGACCDIATAACHDHVPVLDCLATGPTWRTHPDMLCHDLVPSCGDPGACCNTHTAECVDDVLKYNCHDEFHSASRCAELDPACGDLGCCCDRPEPGVITDPHEALRSNCAGRFLPGVVGEACEPEAFAPACGLWVPTGVLYAPTWNDNPDFRATMSALLGGAPVDFWGAYYRTPTLEYCANYAAVFTWVNFPYHDAVLMGNMLADYVDQGGRVILGACCKQGTQGYYLRGRIMDDPAYCPVRTISNSMGTGQYNLDGTQPIHSFPVGTVGEHGSVFYLDVVSALQPGAAWDGTIGSGVFHSYDAIWNAAGSVYYSPGSAIDSTTGGADGYPTLIANMVTYVPRPGACCNVHTAECSDELLPADCVAHGPGWISHPDATYCADLVPSCGDPGCCCDHPEPGVETAPHFAYHANCSGRFISGATGADCAAAAFDPECGLVGPTAVLYAPSWYDSGGFRVSLSALLGGGTVDYWNAFARTPPLSTMQRYAAVFTWVDYPYADAVAMGNNLADYVDAGGRVILGRGCRRSSSSPYGYYLHGRIMDDPAYCPVLTCNTNHFSGTYNGDGQDCPLVGGPAGDVIALSATSVEDVATIAPEAVTDGTWSGGSYVAVYTPTRNIWYSPGNTGTDYGTGDWAVLTANEVLCACGASACCDLSAGECVDVLPADCSFKAYCNVLCADLLPPCGDPGACCDPVTGGCVDDILKINCTDIGHQPTSGSACSELDPPCGNPGCCCDRPEPGDVAAPHFAFALNCSGRFIPGTYPFCGDLDENGVLDMNDYNMFLTAFGKCAGQPGYVAAADLNGDGCINLADFQQWRNCYLYQGTGCNTDMFEPECGLWNPVGLLYAPTNPDNAGFRSAVSALVGGAPVTYFDARSGVPSLDDMVNYAACLTWVNYAYNDPVAMGNVLADYADRGGRVILGQWCFHTNQNCWLEGRIMTAAYCPVASASGWSGSVYVPGSGTGVIFNGAAGDVSTLSGYADLITALQPGAASDGRWTTGEPVVAFRPNFGVVYASGHTGLDLSVGDWAILTANILVALVPGACCDIATANCIDHVSLPDCLALGPTWQIHSDILCADLVPPCGEPGACCNIYTGVCADHVLEYNCHDEFHSGACAALNPPCGDPGCCCDFPEPGVITDPHRSLRANCGGRFLSGVLGADCVAEAWVPQPPCGMWVPIGVLYAPTSNDNPSFRSGVSALLGGVPVDFWCPSTQGTPSLDYCASYAAVFTWADYPYVDPVAMGDMLADYVDQGGRVILGQWTKRGTQCNCLQGRIMDDPAYCPVLTISDSFGSGQYNRDGSMCATQGPQPPTGAGGLVTSLSATYLDVISTLADGALSDGTWSAGGYVAVWRGDSRVWYSAGNTGADYTTGDVAILTANEVVCAGTPGACCDSVTANCIDHVSLPDCVAMGPTWRIYSDILCADLNPPCGNPGACCDDATAQCADGVAQAVCTTRLAAGTLCNELSPACGEIPLPDSCVGSAHFIAPGSWSGTTCGAGSDCALRPSEDYYVGVYIPRAGNWRIDLCASGFWDSYMYVGNSCCTNTWNGDDGCPTYSLLSFLNLTDLTPGWYYVTVEGYASSNCGNFTLTASTYEPAREAVGAQPVEFAPSKLEQVNPELHD